jgi:AraC family transcriptional regulator
MTNDKLTRIRRLVGSVNKEDLRYVDCFVGEEVSLFMPVGGACFYAVTPEHRHPAYLFVIPFDDRTAVKMDGEVLTCRRGRIFCLSPDIPHQELPAESAPRYIAVMIGRRFFERQLAHYGTARPVVFRGDSPVAPQNLLPALQRFMIEADDPRPGSAPVLDALSVEVCHVLIRAIMRMPAPKASMAERVEVNRAIEHLHGHLGEKISVETLAEVARLSPSHFGRVFRRETGRAPMEYVHGLRLERAKKLLLAGDRSITDIALECGFGSSSYLSTCFLKQFRMTPREYQRSATGRVKIQRKQDPGTAFRDVAEDT